jgi:hypothetical protein
MIAVQILIYLLAAIGAGVVLMVAWCASVGIVAPANVHESQVRLGDVSRA